MIKTDDREVMKAFANLTPKKMNNAYKAALKKSVAPIQKQGKINLRKSGIKNVSKKYRGKNGKLYPSMVSGIKTSINTRTPGEEYAKVHILGEFRLKWFEKGTKKRVTKKGYNRGIIHPKWFFKKSVNQKSKEAVDTLDENIRTSIMKAWERK